MGRSRTYFDWWNIELRSASACNRYLLHTGAERYLQTFQCLQCPQDLNIHHVRRVQMFTIISNRTQVYCVLTFLKHFPCHQILTRALRHSHVLKRQLCPQTLHSVGIKHPVQCPACPQIPCPVSGMSSNTVSSVRHVLKHSRRVLRYWPYPKTSPVSSTITSCLGRP